MSGPDAKFPAEEREKLLAEVREYLPAFLHRRSSEQHDPAGDVRELLNLEREDLDRVIAVHQCLDPAVLAFGAALRDGLRRPIASSIRPIEISQSVRGPIDWAQTSGRRALAAGDPSLFVVRPARRIFDTPDNKALAWLLERLISKVDAAITWRSSGQSPETGADRAWWQRLEALRDQLAEAQSVQWLSAVAPELPTAASLRSLRATRNEFYAERVAPALESVLRLTDPSPETLTEVLCQRYFRPDKTSLLFEVAIALRLARAFAARSTRPRRTRLLIGEGRSSFARYSFEDGAEVTLAYQAWPDSESSMRRRLGKRHALGSRGGRPDIFVIRTGPNPDTVVLELKASFGAEYLREGLKDLLGYLADRPDLWIRQPSGWLVAPASVAFQNQVADEALPLWIVSADQVAAAATERFASRSTG